MRDEDLPEEDRLVLEAWNFLEDVWSALFGHGDDQLIHPIEFTSILGRLTLGERKALGDLGIDYKLVEESIVTMCKGFVCCYYDGSPFKF